MIINFLVQNSVLKKIAYEATSKIRNNDNKVNDFPDIRDPWKVIALNSDSEKIEVPEIEGVPAGKVALLSQRMTQITEANHQSASFNRNDSLLGEEILKLCRFAP